MAKEGKKGRALTRIVLKKKVLLTAGVILGIVDKVGEQLEKYIQTHSEVPHEEIVEHLSSILKNNGIVPYGKGIDTANLTCYQYPWQTSNVKSDSQIGATNEADKPSSRNDERSKRVRASPKGLSMDHARDKFFPFWKSVLSARSPIRIAPPSQPSNKDTRSTEPSKKTARTEQSKDIQCAEKPSPAAPHGFAKDLVETKIRMMDDAQRA
ncbi:hypothetical protein EJB05_51045, partial [Eragrostis curvula]